MQAKNEVQGALYNEDTCIYEVVYQDLILQVTSSAWSKWILHLKGAWPLVAELKGDELARGIRRKKPRQFEF